MLDTKGIIFGISMHSFFKVRYFQRVQEFNGFQVINQFAGSPNVPHLSPSFVETIIQHYKPSLKSTLHFSYKATSPVTIYGWLKKLEDRASDAPGISLQWRKRFKFVNELVEIVCHSSYCPPKYLV